MGGFKKGDEPKRGRGRPPGTKNKTTAQIKDCFRQILSGSLPQLIEDLKELPAKDRVTLLLKLSDKVIPSLKSIDQVVENKGITTLGFMITNEEDEQEDKS
tara:strand:- start:899 stop:1201 length:303 start_codon:yes stop_codon:yes gene_type:complete